MGNRDTLRTCAQPKAKAKARAKTEVLEALAVRVSKVKVTRGAEKEEAALEEKALVERAGAEKAKVERAGAEKAKVAGSAKDKAGATRDTASRAARRATKHSSAEEEHQHRKPRTPWNRLSSKKTQ